MEPRFDVIAYPAPAQVKDAGASFRSTVTSMKEATLRHTRPQNRRVALLLFSPRNFIFQCRSIIVPLTEVALRAELLSVLSGRRFVFAPRDGPHLIH